MPATPGVKPLRGPYSYPYQPTPEQKARDEEIGRWVQKAQKLLEQNDLRGAQQSAEEALRLTRNQRPVSFWQGFIADDLAPVYLRTGQYGKAAALFDADPFHAMSLNGAIAYLETGRLADARKCWRESQMLYYHRDFMPYLPGLSSAKAFEATMFLCRGITDVDQNRSMNAIWALHHAVQLVPTNPLALWCYAEALANASRPGEARHFFQAAIARDHGLIARRAREGMGRLGHFRGR